MADPLSPVLDAPKTDKPRIPPKATPPPKGSVTRVMLTQAITPTGWGATAQDCRVAMPVAPPGSAHLASTVTVDAAEVRDHGVVIRRHGQSVLIPWPNVRHVELAS